MFPANPEIPEMPDNRPYFHWLGRRAEPFHQTEQDERELLERDLPELDATAEEG